MTDSEKEEEKEKYWKQSSDSCQNKDQGSVLH